MRTTAELREGFLTFFESKEHLRLPSSSLVPPPEDQSTLLTVAGMQQLKPYLLGLAEPPSRRITSAQKTFRTVDIENVGLTARHLTFFEMLGNFSLGDYFKDGAIDFAWEFVTEHMRFDPDVLWASVFAGDPELGLGPDEQAIEGWKRIGMPAERIVRLSRKDNFWQQADTGPCGPNSELHLDRGEQYGCGRPDCAPGCDCDRYLEFWNLVFMEFDLHEDGTLTPLPEQNVDTGLGLERGAMLLQGVDSVFETDTFQALMKWVESESGVAYGESPVATKAHRILADHGRAMTFLVADGVTPSNEGRGYVLRRIVRRAVPQARAIGLQDLWRISEVVREQMAPWYPELADNQERIEEILRGEEERFAETLERGLGLFEDVAAQGAISGEDAFKLHDTYGFPFELTKELAGERNLPVDEDTFKELMEGQRRQSRTERDVRVVGAPEGPPTRFVGYEKTDVLTALLWVNDLGDGRFEATLEESPFYPEGGGQVSDVGYLEHDETGKRAEVEAVTQVGEHVVLTLRGDGFAAGDRVRAVVPWNVRFPTMANHTATHLLHRALREVLGEHVRQAGSAVRPDKLRFDFTHGQALSPEERAEVERLVNEKIFENLPVRAFVTPIDEARKLGAMMLFGEKYGDEVRVVEIPGFSRELCGGTHVRSTAEIGPFVILSESSVGSGARRIEALTSGAAFTHLTARAHEADQLREELTRVRKEGKKAGKVATETEVVFRDESGDVVVAEVQALKGAALRDLSDQIRQSKRAPAVLLGSVDNGRAYLVVNLDSALVERGADAVAVVRKAAKKIDGGGGGRPDLAEAGGKNPAGLAEAYEVGKRELASILS